MNLNPNVIYAVFLTIAIIGVFLLTLYVLCNSKKQAFQFNNNTVDSINSKLGNLLVKKDKKPKTYVSKSVGKITYEGIDDSSKFSLIKLFLNPKETIVTLLRNYLIEMIKDGKFENIPLDKIPTIPLVSNYKLVFDSLSITSDHDNINIDIDNAFIPHIKFESIVPTLDYKDIQISYYIKIPNLALNLSVSDDKDNVILNMTIVFSINIGISCKSNCEVKFTNNIKDNSIFGIKTTTGGIFLNFTDLKFNVENFQFDIVNVHVSEKDKYTCPEPYIRHGRGYICSQPADIETKDCKPSKDHECKKYTHYFKTKYSEKCDTICDNSTSYKGVNYQKCPWVDDTSFTVSGNSCMWDNSVCPPNYTPSMNTCVVDDKSDWTKEELLMKSFGIVDGNINTKKISDYIIKTFNFQKMISDFIENKITDVNYFKLYKLFHSKALEIDFILNVTTS